MNLIYPLAAVAALSWVLPATAQQNAPSAPFALQSHALKTLSEAKIAKEEAGQTQGAKSPDDKTLTFSTSSIRLVARTGPEDDMLSYRIGGLRNPTLVVPPNAVLNVLFVNTDEDMPHDFHVGDLQPPFPLAPSTEGTVGSAKLPHEENERFSGEELSLRAARVGSFSYFCSVRGHAKGGMFGTIAVGTAPAPAPQDPHASHDGMAGMDTSNMNGMKMGNEHSGHNGAGMNMGSMAAMPSTIDLLDPMSRESSGTAWLPDSSPMYMQMKMRGKTMLMLHGSAYPRYTDIGSKRDVSIAGKGSKARFDAPSMVMVMASRPSGSRAQIGGRVMLSTDPFIERGYGYPLLYQSGESYGGQPIHDRQHPHDLFSELSLSYSLRTARRQSLSFYLGYPGEPALGPPTFMHRVSGIDGPDAPISHHWQDSTHITFGVATLGYSFGRFKLEGSTFKGQEPDENRTNFDSPRFDSASARLSWNPTRDLALQVSHGFLKKPEPGDPQITARHRTTASVILNRAIGNDSNWANTLVWGQNLDVSEGRSNSYLFETALQRRENTFYGRFENVQKSGHELVLPAPLDEGLYGVNSLSLGYVRDLRHGKGLDVGLGAQATFGFNPASLAPIYGGTRHTGFQIFLRIRPSRMKMDESMSGMKMSGQ